MSFGDHLRADEHVETAVRKFCEHVFQFAFVRHCVAVNSGDTHLWKLLCKLIGNVFGAFANEIEKFAFAFRACFGRFLAMIAVMTEKFVVAAMKCERDVAIWTFESFAAGSAENELRKAASI